MREVYWGVSRRLLFLIAFFLLAAVLLFAPLPMQTTLAGRTLENAGHTPLFLLATLGTLIVAPTFCWQARACTRWQGCSV